MAQQTAYSMAGSDQMARYLQSLEKRIADLEQALKRQMAVSYRDGSRQRMLVGLDSSNGKYGIKIWDTAGTLQYTNQF